MFRLGFMFSQPQILPSPWYGGKKALLCLQPVLKMISDKMKKKRHPTKVDIARCFQFSGFQVSAAMPGWAGSAWRQESVDGSQ